MTKTAKHLPLSLGVQAALEVLALPTQEECDMLQPSQAKLGRASLVGSSGFYQPYTLSSMCVFPGYLSCRPAVRMLTVICSQ